MEGIQKCKGGQDGSSFVKCVCNDDGILVSFEEELVLFGEVLIRNFQFKWFRLFVLKINCFFDSIVFQ